MLEKKSLKIKHNKKRNTAFLYEVLVKELTKCVVEKDSARKNAVLSICKQHFSSGTMLKRELDLYKEVRSSANMEKDIAEKVLQETKRQYLALDKQKIFSEQSKLINKINKALGTSVYSNFVPEYKNIATVAQIFGDSLPPKEKVLLETKLVEKMCMNPEEKQQDNLKPIDNLTYKLFVKKFNEQYSGELLTEQKSLLTKFITSFSDNGLELKIFLNEEIGRIKESLNSAVIKNKEIASDIQIVKKTKALISLLETYRKKEIDDSMIKEVLKLQSLVNELNSEENKSGN